MYRPPKRNSNKRGLIILIGCGILLIIILFVAAKSEQPKKKRPSTTKSGGTHVNLTEHQKKEMYRSLSALRGMLRNAGGNPQRSYEILSDRYKVPAGVVREVEAEGYRKGWPRSQ